MKEIGSYNRASRVDEALELAAEFGGDGEFIAGGQSLTNLMKQRLVGDDIHLIDISDLDLDFVRVEDGVVRIGALNTHADLLESDIVAEHLPRLAEMIEQVADAQIRNAGTIGGDVAHADPSSDYPIFLAAVDASYRIRSPDGTRTIGSERFFDGYFRTDLASDEILTEVRIPVPPDDAETGFSKFARRKGDFALVNAAAALTFDADAVSEARIRVGGVGGMPTRPADAEEYLEGRSSDRADPETVGDVAAEEITPDVDERTSREYKEKLVGAMVRRSVGRCLDARQGGDRTW